jgi:hypothetical protein
VPMIDEGRKWQHRCFVNLAKETTTVEQQRVRTRSNDTRRKAEMIAAHVHSHRRTSTGLFLLRLVLSPRQRELSHWPYHRSDERTTNSRVRCLGHIRSPAHRHDATRVARHAQIVRRTGANRHSRSHWPRHKLRQTDRQTDRQTERERMAHPPLSMKIAIERWRVCRVMNDMTSPMVKPA